MNEIQPVAHRPGDMWCMCSTCRKHRLAYALLVAKNHGDITQEDYDAGMLILDVYLSAEEL